MCFSSTKNTKLEAYLNFPIQHNKLFPLTDANWGPQDQSVPDPATPKSVPQLTVRSMSSFIVYHNGPLTWIAKRQRVTARSSAEAEIYATEKCVKEPL